MSERLKKLMRLSYLQTNPLFCIGNMKAVRVT